MTADRSELGPVGNLDALLACPRHRSSLSRIGDTLHCPQGDSFPVVAGVPVLLNPDLPSTHSGWWTRPEHLLLVEQDTTDPRDFVRENIMATCGNLYRTLREPFRYPIPELPLPAGNGRVLVDLGGNWGRWSIAAARAGYRVVCVDASLQAAAVGRRIAAELGVDVQYVVGDVRALPLRDSCVDVAFSYSVLQQLPREAVTAALMEAARVTRAGGYVRVQMPNVLGLRQLMNHGRRVLQESLSRARRGVWPKRWMFYVRGWTLPALRREMEGSVGASELSVDGFFSLNAQRADLDLLAAGPAVVVKVSDVLRGVAERVPSLIWVADSVYVSAVNEKRAWRGQRAPLTAAVDSAIDA